MRWTRLLVAGALALGAAWTPGVAAANQRGAVSRPLSPDLTALVTWVQRISAAQQPALIAYRQCQPIMERAMTLLGDAKAMRALLPEMTGCMADFETASRVSSSQLVAEGPMPTVFERMIGVDSAAMMRQSAATLEAMAIALRDVRNGVEKAADGDLEAARALFRKGKVGAVASIDAQIQILQLLAKSTTAPAVRPMVELRVAFARVLRAALLAEETRQGVEVGDSLRSLAPEARDALGRLRKDWATSSAPMRQAAARLGDPRRESIVARMDGAYQTVFARADMLVHVLDQAPVGTAQPADVQRVIMKVAEFEIHIQEMAASLSSSMVEKH